MGNNNYYNGSNYIYQNSDYATQYQQASGTHFWRISPSGTAGNAISFTQAMILGSNSGLSIGTPSAAPSQGLLVQGSAGIGTTSVVARLSVVGASTVIGQTNVSARFSDDLNSTLLISHPGGANAAATITGNENLAFATGVVGSIA
jgi:hypothetical protein